MSAIRWIFRHMLLVFAATVVVIGIIYWDAIRPELVKAGMLDEISVAEATQKPTAAPASPMVESKPAPASAPALETTSSPAPAPQPAQANAVQPQGPSVASAQAPARPQIAVRPTPHNAPSAQASAPTRPAAPSLSADLRRDWAAARSAYWQRDLKKAASLYEALATKYPTQADIYGEMGNLYLAMGQRDKAVSAYVLAGESLLKSDRVAAANKAVAALRMLSPSKATELRNKILSEARK